MSYRDPKHYPIGQFEHRYCSVLFLLRSTIPYINLYPLFDDPLDSSSLEGRVKGENENREYESSCEESVGEKNNRDKRDTGESIEEEEKGVEVNIGNCVTEEEEDGTVLDFPIVFFPLRLLT
jgi:hypothetical protein